MLTCQDSLCFMHPELAQAVPATDIDACMSIIRVIPHRFPPARGAGLASARLPCIHTLSRVTAGSIQLSCAGQPFAILKHQIAQVVWIKRVILCLITRLYMT